MSALTWDAAGTRRYETGVNHCALYVQNASHPEQYGPAVAWNGITGITESPDGAEPNDLWADNIKYATLRSAETFGATIEAYTYPKEFLKCDGVETASNGVYVGQQGRVPFGLCYRTEIGSDTMAADTDAGYKLHIIYNATASPSERSYETINDSPDAITFSWEITTTGIPVDGYKSVSTITIDTTKLGETEQQNFKYLEYALFGCSDPHVSLMASGYLPKPDEVVQLLAGNSSYFPSTSPFYSVFRTQPILTP